MKRFLLSMFALVLLAGGIAVAQTNRLPIPSGVCDAIGGVLYSSTTNDVTCLAAVASGQVLTSAGTGTAPAWSAAPSLTSITLVSTITRISDLSFTVTPDAVSATSCAAQSVTIGNLTTSDRLIINPAAISAAGTYTAPVSFVAARVSAAGIAAFVYCNSGSGSATPPSGTFTGFAVRKS